MDAREPERTFMNVLAWSRGRLSLPTMNDQHFTKTDYYHDRSVFFSIVDDRQPWVLIPFIKQSLRSRKSASYIFLEHSWTFNTVDEPSRKRS